jgi:hypothetical protein
MALTVKGLIFHEFKSNELRENHKVATWNLRMISACFSKQRKTKKCCVEVSGRKTLWMCAHF